MEILNNLIMGFGVAVTPIHLLYAFIGVLLGTLIGVLPGVGPVATIAMLLPITFNLSPVAALIMLAGIYYGSMYGGTITSVLLNLPGEAASVVTTIDGYQMARQGRAGAALAASAVGSFFAGTVATLLIAAFAPPQAGPVVAADAHRSGEPPLHVTPCGRQTRGRGFEHDRRRPGAGAIDVELMIAHADQPARARELAPLERGGHALIRGSGQQDEDDHRAGGAERATQRGSEEGHYDSISASPYFSIRE